MNNILIIGVSQAIFLSVFLLTKKENRMANRLLAALLFLIGFSLFLNYLYASGQIQSIPHLIGLDTAFPFLYTPILYLYTKILVSKDGKMRSKDALHLIPFGVYFGYVFFNFYLETAQYKLDFLMAMRNLEVPADIVVFNYFKIVQAFVYLFFTLKVVGNYQSSIEDHFSTKYRINLSWLKMLGYSLLAIYIIKLIGIIIPLFLSTISTGEVEVLTDLSVIIFVYLIAFGAIRQPSIFSNWKMEQTKEGHSETQEKTHEESLISERPKYSGSGLSSGESQQILSGLLALMEEEKTYLNNGLTIKDLSEQLAVPSKVLSQVINEQLNQNFFNFVNNYRVNEVKRRLGDPTYKHLSILGIALECGFSSKSSFNSIFKRKTGLTPTQYINELAADSQQA